MSERDEIARLRNRIDELERREHEHEHRPIKYADQWCDTCDGYPGLRPQVYPQHWRKK